MAGGRSRRFGSDKTRLTLGGEDLTARAVRILREAGAARVWVVGGAARDVPGAGFLPDDAPGAGPSGGIATVLNRADEALFVAAADMPALSVPLVKAVVGAWDGKSSAVAPRIDGRWEPLCALYARCALPAMEKAAREGSSLQKVLDDLPAQAVDVPEGLRNGLMNVNTPQEWERYRKQQVREEM